MAKDEPATQTAQSAKQSAEQREATQAAGVPTMTVEASISGDDERWGLELLLNGINTPQKDRRKVKLENAPLDADITIRPRAYPPKTEEVESPTQRREREKHESPEASQKRADKPYESGTKSKQSA